MPVHGHLRTWSKNMIAEDLEQQQQIKHYFCLLHLAKRIFTNSATFFH